MRKKLEIAIIIPDDSELIGVRTEKRYCYYRF